MEPSAVLNSPTFGKLALPRSGFPKVVGTGTTPSCCRSGGGWRGEGAYLNFREVLAIARANFPKVGIRSFSLFAPA